MVPSLCERVGAVRERGDGVKALPSVPACLQPALLPSLQPAFPHRLNAAQGMGMDDFCMALSRCLESLSQKLYAPSDPAVTKVPHWGWNEMAFTAHTSLPSLCVCACVRRWGAWVWGEGRARGTEWLHKLQSASSGRDRDVSEPPTDTLCSGKRTCDT